VILEIGAGRGELTELLVQKAKRIYAVEIDPHLCQILRDNLKGYPNVKIINQDILKLDLQKFLGRFKKRIKVVGNIPYYISSPIIEQLIKSRNKIEAIFITVQKEFAERAAGKPGSKEFGAFSCFVQYFTIPEKIFIIKKTSFFPVPKVDSCFLRLDIKRKTMLGPKQEKLLFKIIRASFNQRRKTLRNSLKDVIPGENLERFFAARRIDRNTRPEKLTLADFASLIRI
jgi:16S rRNA (adenine1518-N6/adenine1519-N6)-dimethyltransferase